MLRWQCDRGVRRVALALLVLAGGWQFLSGAWIQAKAVLAQQLIAAAWSESLAEQGAPVKPWPWADTFPVARLQAPEVGVDLMVLDGLSGQALAFGPGLMRFDQAGATVLAGHRDTHFRFLGELEPGSELRLQDELGRWRQFSVTEVRVADSSRESLDPSSQPGSLLLVTCYPFNALRAGGDLRYLVRANPIHQAEYQL